MTYQVRVLLSDVTMRYGLQLYAKVTAGGELVSSGEPARKDLQFMYEYDERVVLHDIGPISMGYSGYRDKSKTALTCTRPEH